MLAASVFAQPALATFSGRDGRIAAVHTVWREDICGPFDSHTCENAHQRLVTMTATGRGKRVVDRCVNCAMSRLAWSPSGLRMAWSRGARVIPADVAGAAPAWGPTGSSLVFTTGGKIATLDAGGSQRKVADGHSA